MHDERPNAKNLGPYLVLSPGKSGTNTVARILHEKLDVNMGDRFAPQIDESTPGGNYESFTFWKLNKALIYEKLDFPTWYSGVGAAIRFYADRKKPWGIKDNRLAVLLGFYLQFIKSPRIIRCVRPKELCVRDYMLWWQHTPPEASHWYDARMRCIDFLLQGRDHLIIQFDKKQRSDDEIICEIKAKWPDI